MIKVPKRAQIAAIQWEILTLERSYREADGVVRNQEMLRQINALKAAIRTIQKSK